MMPSGFRIVVPDRALVLPFERYNPHPITPFESTLFMDHHKSVDPYRPQNHVRIVTRRQSFRRP